MSDDEVEKAITDLNTATDEACAAISAHNEAKDNEATAKQNYEDAQEAYENDNSADNKLTRDRAKASYRKAQGMTSSASENVDKAMYNYNAARKNLRKAVFRMQNDPSAYNPWRDPATYDGVGAAAGDGAQAWVDGVIPFADPLARNGAYDPSDPTLKVSQFLGGVSRNALISAGNGYFVNQMIPAASWGDKAIAGQVWLGALVNAN